MSHPIRGAEAAGRWTVRVGTALLVILFAASCVIPRPRSVTYDAACGTLTGNGMAELIAWGETQRDWLERIVATFQVTPDQLTVTKVAGGQEHLLTSYEWSAEQATYFMTTKDGTPSNLRVLFLNPAPSLGSVIDCLGPPDYYSIAYGAPPDAANLSYMMDFYYTSQGIHVAAEDAAPTLLSKADISKLAQPANIVSPVEFIDWVAPGTVGEIDWQIFNPGGVATAKEKAAYLQERTGLDHLSAWPGAIDRLRVTWIDPLRLPEE